ncbi:protein-glutamate O-methyltransferase CheR [Novosphingobium sp.]|uniref:CheR family methyltransferase n=1 Tax=Novosphingobium sp. TaxID=1874826 RepID=UPI0025D0E8F6|nr:protein-glutamate O-methyltransferase CheR [Novosphingobium sp.]MCC6924873.1 protein-glutamate O-methyltransferase CheR [Novosphingobium sp.]
MERNLHQQFIPIIARLFKQRTGQVLNDDRIWRIDRAIETVVRQRGLGHSADLMTLLTEPDAASVEQDLVEALLNNETYFFRDRPALEKIANQFLPQLAQAKSATRQLTIWSAGCSTGQEALSLAILLHEHAAQWHGWTIRIVATDVSQNAIATARRGVYTKFEIQRGLGVGQMLEHFTETPDGWKASDALHRSIRFSVQNLLEGPPAGEKFDLVLCRNLLLYFDDATKRVAFQHLAAGMAPHALLLLGGGETVLDPSLGFASTASDCSLYRLNSGNHWTKSAAA